jgi:peroxiredoxin
LWATTSAVVAGVVNVAMRHGGSSGKLHRLNPGDPAPAFSLMGSDGRVHSLRDHIGKRAVVLAWFPKAYTGG